MGMDSFFKAGRASHMPALPPMAEASRDLVLAKQEKSPRFTEDRDMETKYTSRFDPGKTSIASSLQSSFVDDIKHEVMCNYLYQQQCSHMWATDGSGKTEGILIRKTKNTYMACPPQLAVSHFSQACAALNCQVIHILPRA
jgi:hypothetical protein